LCAVHAIGLADLVEQGVESLRLGQRKKAR
jgi:hypothetical protein